MTRLFVPVVVVALALAAPATAQTGRRATEEESERVRSLQNYSVWMGFLVGERDGAVVVAMPVRPPEGVDLRGGDVIQLVNGARVAGVPGLERSLDGIATARPVRVAVLRNGRNVTVTFAKPADMPRGTVQVQRRNP